MKKTLQPCERLRAAPGAFRFLAEKSVTNIDQQDVDTGHLNSQLHFFWPAFVRGLVDCPALPALPESGCGAIECEYFFCIHVHFGLLNPTDDARRQPVQQAGRA